MLSGFLPLQDSGCTENNYGTIRFDEWTSFFEHLSMDHNNIIIVGNVNFHLDVNSNIDARKFNDSLATRGLVQHVDEPTHQKGHTLDVVITKDSNDIISKLEVIDPVLCDKAGYRPAGRCLQLVRPIRGKGGGQKWG